MKKNSLKFSLTLLLLLALLPIQNLQAQEVFPDDTLDVPAAPINDYLPLLMVAGIGLGFVFLKRRVIQKV